MVKRPCSMIGRRMLNGWNDIPTDTDSLRPSVPDDITVWQISKYKTKTFPTV